MMPQPSTDAASASAPRAGGAVVPLLGRVVLPALLGIAVSGLVVWKFCPLKPEARGTANATPLAVDSTATGSGSPVIREWSSHLPSPRDLPPEDSVERLIIAASAGDLARAKAYLLDWQPDGDRSPKGRFEGVMNADASLLGIVAERDPGFIRQLLAAYRPRIGDDKAFEEFEVSLCYRTLCAADDDIWHAADLYPWMRPGLRQLCTSMQAEPLPADQALHALDPAYALDDDTVARCCARSQDARVLAGLLERISRGGCGGTIPPATRLTLGELRQSQPEAYAALAEKMTPQMQAQIPGGPASPAPQPGEAPLAAAIVGHLGTSAIPTDEMPQLLERCERAGQPVTVAMALQSPDSPGSLAYLMAQPDYLGRHRDQILAEMTRLAADPATDANRLHEFVHGFVDGCVGYNGNDVSQAMPWLSFMSEEDRKHYLQRYATSDPAGMMKYAEEKMPPGPERDAVRERAVAELP